jgi:hypothetical protein
MQPYAKPTDTLDLDADLLPFLDYHTRSFENDLPQSVSYPAVAAHRRCVAVMWGFPILLILGEIGSVSHLLKDDDGPEIGSRVCSPPGRRLARPLDLGDLVLLAQRKLIERLVTGNLTELAN